MAGAPVEGGVDVLEVVVDVVDTVCELVWLWLVEVVLVTACVLVVVL
jgi:hypothetical protein